MAVHTPFLRRLDPLAAWTVYRYALPLRAFSTQREGLIIHTILKDGREGWGEIAPFPGRSRETLDQACDQLLKILRGNCSSSLYPSVAFGIESALIPYDPPSAPFPLWALLSGSSDQIIEQAAQAKEEGFRHLKVKIGHLTPSEALRAVHPLVGHIILRLDVNKAWGFDEAVSFFSSFPPDAVAYIEEPTRELDQLHRFPFPFALDESIGELSYCQLVELPHLSTLIIKPSIQGGSYALSLLEQLGKSLLFTGTFESGIGTAQIALLAYRLRRLGIPLGLDTYRYLGNDILTSPLFLSQGSLYLPTTLQLNPHGLIEIAQS
jgi:O-succinylbenzoate synthase